MDAARYIFAGFLALALGAPSVEAAPTRGRDAKPSRGKRGRKVKREMRRGMPVLRSRVTPGRTRNSRTREAPAAPSGTAAEPLVIPAAHIELSVDGMRQGNAELEFEGGVRAGRVATNSLSIFYPMAGAEGRELTLKCEGSFSNDVTVSTGGVSKVSYNQTYVHYDKFVIKEKTNGKSRDSIKLLIDTTVQPGDVENYNFRVRIEAYPTPSGSGGGSSSVVNGYVKPMGMSVTSCTLDLAES